MLAPPNFCHIAGMAGLCFCFVFVQVDPKWFSLLNHLEGTDLILLCLCLYVRDTYYEDRNGPVFEERDRTYNFYS